MQSWETLPDVPLGPAGQVTEEIIGLRLRDYRGAARYLNRLPYGRNSNRTDALAVLRESCGTCSTKHALLKLLAMEQQIEIALVVGIYEMSGHNTPGVGRVLAKYSLACVPEAHCYLRYDGIRIDVTRALAEAPAEPIGHFYTRRRSARRRSGNIRCTSTRILSVDGWLSDVMSWGTTTTRSGGSASNVSPR